MDYLLYGANGYTASLIIKESIQRNLRPILAGRNREKIEALAHQYQLPYRIFDLTNPSDIEKELEKV